MINKIISTALELLESFEENEHKNTDDVHWVEDSDGNSDWGDFCGDCVENAVKEARKDYILRQRKLPINKRDDEFLKFESKYNYGGGYEDDSFNYCNDCGKRLEITILPGVEELDDCIESLKNGSKIDDYLGYKCYWLLYNNWGNDNKENDKNNLWGKTNVLANRVISALTKNKH